MDNPKAIISLNNISHNIQQIKAIAPTSKILAVIKADAYGHGAVNVSKHLENNPNVNAFGVSRYNEAKKIFDAGIQKPILLMEGVIDAEQLKNALINKFWLVVQNFDQLALLTELKSQAEQLPIANIWLKFDTGMHRLGFAANGSDLDKIVNSIDDLIASKIINPQVVIMSHFACADELEHQLNQQQINQFDLLKEKFEKYPFEFSMANSAGIFNMPLSHNDWIRPGITIYGSWPFANKNSEQLNLKPTMQMLSKVIAIKNVQQNDTVGYNATWTADKHSIIAIVATGYGDGYPRIASKTSTVFLNNTKCPIVGRVSMDMLAVDCTSLGQENLPKVGDVVELWGEHVSIDEVALACNTISYELFTKITSRVEKSYI